MVKATRPAERCAPRARKLPAPPPGSTSRGPWTCYFGADADAVNASRFGRAFVPADLARPVFVDWSLSELGLVRNDSERECAPAPALHGPFYAYCELDDPPQPGSHRLPCDSTPDPSPLGRVAYDVLKAEALLGLPDLLSAVRRAPKYFEAREHEHHYVAAWSTLARGLLSLALVPAGTPIYRACLRHVNTAEQQPDKLKGAQRTRCALAGVALAGLVSAHDPIGRTWRELRDGPLSALLRCNALAEVREAAVGLLSGDADEPELARLLWAVDCAEAAAAGASSGGTTKMAAVPAADPLPPALVELVDRIGRYPAQNRGQAPTVFALEHWVGVKGRTLSDHLRRLRSLRIVKPVRTPVCIDWEAAQRHGIERPT